MTKIILLLALALAVSAPAHANTIKYFQDPVLERGADGHPMDEIIRLSKTGDVRAQYILGDLYAKGKGGLVKSENKGREWFEKSAVGGYYPAFIRLAALAKRAKKKDEAYKWYSLCTEYYLSPKDKRHCSKERDALGLAAKDIDGVKKEISAWKVERVREQREAAEQKKIQERREAMKAKVAAREEQKKDKTKKTEETSQEPANKEIRVND